MFTLNGAPQKLYFENAFASQFVSGITKPVYMKKLDIGRQTNMLTPVLQNCLCLFFIYLKLELLTQFPASNE